MGRYIFPYLMDCYVYMKTQFLLCFIFPSSSLPHSKNVEFVFCFCFLLLFGLFLWVGSVHHRAQPPGASPLGPQRVCVSYHSHATKYMRDYGNALEPSYANELADDLSGPGRQFLLFLLLLLKMLYMVFEHIAFLPMSPKSSRRVAVLQHTRVDLCGKCGRKRLTEQPEQAIEQRLSPDPSLYPQQ